jgi:hypothetical protein
MNLSGSECVYRSEGGNAPRRIRRYENPDDHIVTRGNRTDGGADRHYAGPGFFHYGSGEGEKASPQSDYECAGEHD